MKYSILHISDIHKNPDMVYESLIQSLERDMEFYTVKENIVSPSFIVVSGDLVQGAYKDEIIQEQYREVESFLNGICNRFLNGDKSRVLIVPGNHDINRSMTIASMEPSTQTKDNDSKIYFSGSPLIRWNWKDCRFYSVRDSKNYNERFHLFVEFYNRFYAGIRSYPTDPVNEAFVVTDDIFKVSFACFNSCHNLDHLCDTGCISDDALISVGKQLQESYNSGYLNIAVWHHHFYGSPLETNYMDRHFLNSLLNYNVQMGLFGHQHYTQIAEEYSDLLSVHEDFSQRLLLVSSGTLFGGVKVLPIGCHRQYNIIEIDHQNGFVDIEINIREDGNPIPDNKIPYWHTKALCNATNKIQYHMPLKEIDLKKALLDIDKKCRYDNDFIAACEKIKALGTVESEIHKIFLSYLKEVKDYEYVYNNIPNINSVEEAVLKITAAQQLGNRTYIQEILNNRKYRDFQDPFINYLLSTIS